MRHFNLRPVYGDYTWLMPYIKACSLYNLLSNNTNFLQSTTWTYDFYTKPDWNDVPAPS